MKKLSQLLILFLMGVVIISSCKKEDTLLCNGSCPVGYECIDDVCVEIKGSETVVITGVITTNQTWTSDKIYELGGKVVVQGATLTIEPGTIIKGRQGTGSLTTTLIIAKRAKIEACGTEKTPIVFTSVLDNIELGQKMGTNLTKVDNEKWGGLIILGAAPVSTKDGDVLGHIEGIPADESYGEYGGDNANDNSGSLCYVSVRHGGAVIGEGNEINGITLGGVGAGTKVDHIEVVANLDDGIELFGGTVNLSNVVITYQGDDGIDIDQNWSGTINNFYILHGGGDTDEGLEIDGPEGTSNTNGRFTLINGTVISEDGTGSCADMKSKAQGTIDAVVFKGYIKFLNLSASFTNETDCDEKTDAYTNMLSDNLVIKNSQVVADNNGILDFVTVYSKKTPNCLTPLKDAYEMEVDDKISNGNNVVSTTTAVIGANLAEFKNWSWTDQHGLLF